MNADWTATLDPLLASGRFDPARIGYWGLSMGTILGLLFVASEPRISVAALGACGFIGATAGRGLFAERLRADAPRVTCPVLFMVQWDDEIFDRDGAFDPFEGVGQRVLRLGAVAAEAMHLRGDPFAERPVAGVRGGPVVEAQRFGSVTRSTARLLNEGSGR
jgi:hypothetical protein